jgi:hypothetical protein
VAGRIPVELKHLFTVEGVKDVIGATNAVAMAQKAAYDQAARAGAAASAKLAATALTSNNAVANAAKLHADHERRQASGRALDPVAAAMAARRRAMADAAVVAARAQLAEQAQARNVAAAAQHAAAMAAAQSRHDDVARTDPAKAAADLAAFKAAADAELASVRAVTQAFIDQSHAADDATRATINEARAAESAARQQVALQSAIKRWGDMATKVLNAVVSPIRLAIRGLEELAHVGVKVLKALAHQAFRVVHGLVSISKKAFKASVSFTVGGLWRGATTLFHGVAHAIGSVVHGLESIIKKAALAATALYTFKNAAEVKLVKDSVADARAHGEEVQALNADTKLFNSQRDTGSYRDQNRDHLDRSQNISSASRAYGLDPKATAAAFSEFSKNLSTAFFDPSSQQGALLKQLGVQTHYRETGEALSSEQVMAQVAQRIARVPAALQNMVIEKLFGGNADALKLLMTMSQSDGNFFAVGAARANALGTKLDQADLIQLETFKRSVWDLHDAWEGVHIAIARRVLPVLEGLARFGTRFLSTYRVAIANLVGTQFRNFVKDVVMIGVILERETGFVERLTGAADRYQRRNSPNIILRAYQEYLQYVKPTFPWLHQQFKSLAHTVKAFGHELSLAWNRKDDQLTRFRWLLTARDWAAMAGHAMGIFARASVEAYAVATGAPSENEFPKLDKFVLKVMADAAKVKVFAKDMWWALSGQGQNIAASGGFNTKLAAMVEKAKPTLASFVEWTKKAWHELMLVFSGQTMGTEFETWVGRLANSLSNFVSYVRSSFSEVAEVIAGSPADQAMQTFAGRMAQDIKWLVDQAKNLWPEFLKVLGEGPESRGESTMFPWMAKMVAAFDAVSHAVTVASEPFKLFYAVLDNTIGVIARLAGTNTGDLLLFVTGAVLLFGRVTTIVKAVGAALTLLGADITLFGTTGAAGLATLEGAAIARVGGIRGALMGLSTWMMANPMILLLGTLLGANLAVWGKVAENRAYNATEDQRLATISAQIRQTPGQNESQQERMARGGANAAQNDESTEARLKRLDTLASGDLLKGELPKPPEDRNLVNLYLSPETPPVKAHMEQTEIDKLMSDQNFRTGPAPAWNR